MHLGKQNTHGEKLLNFSHECLVSGEVEKIIEYGHMGITFKI
jgi:hypothetical protein